MLPSVSLLLPLFWEGVLGIIAPLNHPNVTSGDLLENDDYSDAIPEREGLPQWIRLDRDGNVNAMFVMHYGQLDKIVAVTNETILVTKKRIEGANSDEIYHIHLEDAELKNLFTKALGLDPSQVTVVHMTYSKDESVKKIVVKDSVMGAAEIWNKLSKAVS